MQCQAGDGTAWPNRCLLIDWGADSAAITTIVLTRGGDLWLRAGAMREARFCGHQQERARYEP
jgi:hypothetical protein